MPETDGSLQYLYGKQDTTNLEAFSTPSARGFSYFRSYYRAFYSSILPVSSITSSSSYSIDLSPIQTDILHPPPPHFIRARSPVRHSTTKCLVFSAPPPLSPAA